MKKITKKLQEEKRKLNIVFIDFDDIKNPLLGAGQAKATYEVGSLLAKKGHTITSLCSKYPGYKDREENGIKYVHIGAGTKNVRINNLIYILSIPFYVAKLKCDVIIECFTAPISTLFSPLFTNIPVVALPTSFEAERFAKLYHLPFDQIEKIGLKKYKYFLPYTSYFDKKMKTVNPKVLSKIVPEGVGEEFFKIKKVKPKHILFLGRFDMQQKGIDLLLNAYAKVSQKIPYPLVLAGHGPDLNKIKTLIYDLNLQSKVRIVISAYGKTKEKLLKEAIFVAFPSRHEGFSLFSLEALASSLPLVSFNIPGLSWTNKNVALKAKSFDVNDFAAKLIQLSNANIAKEMGDNSRMFAKQYVWSNVADNFENFFYTILKTH